MSERALPSSITDHRKAKLQKAHDYWRMKTQAGEWEKEALNVDEELRKLKGGESPSSSTGMVNKMQELVVTEELLDHLRDIRDDRRKKMDEKAGAPVAVEVKKEEKPDPIVKLADTMVKLGATKDDVKDFLTHLDPQVVTAMYTAGESNPMVPYMMFRTHQTQPQQLTLSDVMQFWKMMPQQNQGVTLDGIATLMSTVMQAVMKNQAPPTPSQPQPTITEMFTLAKSLTEPMYQALSSKDREIMDERMKHVESQIVNPMEWIKGVKDGAKELGFASATTSEMSIEGKKLDFEMEKLRLDQSAKQFERQMDFQKWQAEVGLKSKRDGMILKTITDTLLGPRGPVKKLVDAAAEEGEDRLRGSGTRRPRPTQRSTTTQDEIEGLYPCENCQKEGKNTMIPVPLGASQVVCEVCKSIYTRPQQAEPKDEPS